MKRIFSTLCTLALMLCLLPSTAFAAGEGNMDSGGGGMGQSIFSCKIPALHIAHHLVGIAGAA